MKLPWSKKARKRGPYRKVSPETRANELLAKAWLADLKQNPTYARELARQKFGLSPEPETVEFDDTQQHDLLSVLREAREAKALIKDELGDTKGGTLAGIASIMKELPGIVQSLPQLQQLGQQMNQQTPPQVQMQQESQQPALKPGQQELTTEQRELKNFVERFIALKPEEAAEEVYENREKPGLYSLIWNTLAENTLEDMISLLPMLNTMPQYQFLMTFAVKLTENEGKKWLALLIDEVKRMKMQENEVKSA